jgi:2-oxo-4-hydroxy-4-carboxy-5-ureidoimidazoline decarboxylase
VNERLSAWNESSAGDALDAMIACCSARRWAEGMVASRPIASVQELSATADRIWGRMEEADWLEAFACHPRIGERTAAHGSKKFVAWSQQEQSSANRADVEVLEGLAAGNLLYEERFGFAYIVCATGKSAEEMLNILNRRLDRDRAAELREAAEQQRQITQIRLGKWLVE